MAAERILVVDDDDALLNLVALSLRRRGYQVEQANDGFSALKILASQPPFSVLITDLMMPGMTGQELLREARKMDEHLEVVVVTAAPDLESAITAMRADGAYDYLLKPFESMSHLLLAVERAVSHRRLILERAQLSQQIKQEAERLRALINNTGDAILSAGSDGVLQIINPAAERLLGKTGLVGKDASTSLPPPLAALIANWQVVGGTLPAVVEMPWPDGTVQMISLTPVPEEGETHWGWVAVLRDITHLKRIEDVKSQMMIETASKIQTPLAQAMNALVELNLLTIQNERASEVVQRLYKIWKRIQEWGEDLNALLRIDSGKNLNPRNIDLNVTITEIYTCQARELQRSNGVRLEVNLQPNLPQVYADPDLIHRLLVGLISRAAGRSPAGGSIRLYAQHHNDQVWVTISDDGPAVSDEDLPHIFEKTFANTTSPASESGLEMALVKTIIDRMGGQVWIGGQGKKGSTIFVCLPQSPD